VKRKTALQAKMERPLDRRQVRAVLGEAAERALPQLEDAVRAYLAVRFAPKADAALARRVKELQAATRKALRELGPFKGSHAEDYTDSLEPALSALRRLDGECTFAHRQLRPPGKPADEGWRELRLDVARALDAAGVRLSKSRNVSGDMSGRGAALARVLEIVAVAIGRKRVTRHDIETACHEARSRR